MRLDIDAIEQQLKSHDPVIHPRSSRSRQAAVAIILREANDHTEALFILRAKREGDPWSGQMAFPGGHLEPSDDSLLHAAVRETDEEIGLDLDRAGRFLGQLNEVKANPRGRAVNIIVSPFVFHLVDQGAPLHLNYEVAEVLWGSLNDMYEGHSVTSHDFVVMGRSQEYPGFLVGTEVVWGLTLGMLDHFFSMMDPGWEPL